MPRVKVFRPRRYLDIDEITTLLAMNSRKPIACTNQDIYDPKKFIFGKARILGRFRQSGSFSLLAREKQLCQAALSFAEEIGEEEEKLTTL